MSARSRSGVVRFLGAWLALELVSVLGGAVFEATRRFPMTADCEPREITHCFRKNAIAGSSAVERLVARVRGRAPSGHPLNAQGYLGPDFAARAEATVLTIFGGSTSFPYCDGEDRDELRVALEDELGARYRHRRFEVRNASVVGRSVFETRWAVRYLAETHPSQVVYVQEPINSINQGHDVVYPLERLRELEARPPRGWWLHDPLVSGLLRLTKWAEAIDAERAARRMRAEFGADHPSRYRDRVRFRSIDAAIDDLDAASREYGFTLVLGVLPMRPELPVTVIPGYLRDAQEQTRAALYDLHVAVNGTFEQRARALDIPLVDNATAFEEPAMDRRTARECFCDYVHALPAVKRIQARNIAERVATLVPDATPP